MKTFAILLSGIFLITAAHAEEMCQISARIEAVTEFNQVPYGAEPSDYFKIKDDDGREHIFVYNYSLSDGRQRLHPFSSIELYHVRHKEFGKLLARLDTSGESSVSQPCADVKQWTDYDSFDGLMLYYTIHFSKKMLPDSIPSSSGGVNQYFDKINHPSHAVNIVDSRLCYTVESYVNKELRSLIVACGGTDILQISGGLGNAGFAGFDKEFVYNIIKP
jgi:hypothetical protein